MHEELDNGVFIGEHFECIANEVEGKKPCSSSDALAVYEHESDEGTWYDGYCYSCHQNFSKKDIHTSSIAPSLGIKEGVVFEKKVFENKAKKKERITQEERLNLFKRTSYEANGYCGLSDEMLKFYGHRIEKDNTGKVIAVYYPETREGKLWGYKSRHLPKTFGRGNLGATGGQSDLAGQFKHMEGGKHVILVGGEKDLISAAMMFREYQKTKNQTEYNHYAVVAPTTGEPSAAKQCRSQYEWFDKFEVITIMMDSDDVGREAAQEIAKVLPKDKVRIATLSEKDPNEMLQKGRQKQFISDFFNSKELVNSGITTSNKLRDKIRDALVRPRISLPDVMVKLQEATKGDGLITGRIYNIIGDTSVGKTTFINTMSHHWFFLPNFKVGVVSLEATDGEYGIDLLSYHLSQNLYWIEEDKVLEYLDEPEVIEQTNNLLMNEYGEDRFVVLDDREGTVRTLQSKMEQMFRQHGCNIIILDVASDFLRTLTQEQQAEAFNWQSNFVKEGVTIINALHTKKPPSLRDGMPRKPDEYDALGNSIFVQKASGNMVIYRNKLCKDDPIEQNTTYWDVPKMRQGKTGDKVMALYYDADTRKVYDRDQFFKDNPDKLPVGYDLSMSSFEKRYYEEGGRGYKGEVSNKNFSKRASTPKDERDFVEMGDGVQL